MVNQTHAFRHRDIVRVVKAARAAAVAVSQVAVDPNSGVITVGPGQESEPDKDLDRWLKKQDADQT